MVKRRKRAKAANASDACLADRPELVDRADVQSEIWHYRSALVSHHRHENDWFGVIVKNNNKPTYLFILLSCKN